MDQQTYDDICERADTFKTLVAVGIARRTATAIVFNKIKHDWFDHRIFEVLDIKIDHYNSRL